MGNRALCLLRTYWERLHMVDHAGGYYVEHICRERGVTQGDTISPTVFNVVVDAVVLHWEYLVMEGDGGNDS